MKIRIKFRKYGNMKFIGHLDVMRYFQKAIRRADVGIRYSEGFSPHQIMSFAAPLGVGITSEGEYLDIEVVPPEEGSHLTERLNAAMAEEWVQGLLDFYGQDEVLISKKTKKGEKQLDLKQLVYELSASMEDGSPVIFMKISTGSTENIKPELVLDAYYQHRGEERPAFAWMTCRREVYADLVPEQKKEQGLHQFIPLMDLGETIA